MSVIVYADPDCRVYAIVTVEILEMNPAQAELHLARLLLRQADWCDNSDTTCERILNKLNAGLLDGPPSPGRELAAASAR